MKKKIKIEIYLGKEAVNSLDKPAQLEIKKGKLLVKGTECEPDFSNWPIDGDVAVVSAVWLRHLKHMAYLAKNSCA